MNKTFIVAEMSANHIGKLENALQIIRTAKKIGADAIKIQTSKPEYITINSNKKEFIIHGGTLWDNKTFYDLYTEANTPWEWHAEIFRVAKEEGLICFSSPFSTMDIDFLETLGNPIYKIASFEIVDVGLIERAAKTGKPIIMSTGIATLEDIELAIETCHKAGNYDITLLKCTSSYPAPLEKANLLTIPDMKNRFSGVKVGVSDHSMTDTIAITAVALGATVVEKHLILDRKMGGADCGFSMEPGEFQAMIKSIREVEKVLGSVSYPQDPSEIESRWSCRSLFICQDMKKGDILTPDNLRSIRPGHGLHPKYLPQLLGKTVNRDLEMGTPMSFDYIL